MIILLQANKQSEAADLQYTIDILRQLPGIEIEINTLPHWGTDVIEIYLYGDTAALHKEDLAALPGVLHVLPLQEKLRSLSRPALSLKNAQGFVYNGVSFNQDNLNVFAGLCAVDTREHVESMMRALKAHGQHCTRMGAYKPRTNPYTFQGHGKYCLPDVFELAGKYDIRVIAMEVTHERHIDEIAHCLEQTGHPTGVMLQIGTRNAQNFELLRSVGKQQEFPILFKRGFGISLSESLHAAEYIAAEGNSRIIFCLRGVQSHLGAPHRNLVDFTHVPVVKRLTHMPVCVDPSHSVGIRDKGPDLISDVFHATAQGIIAGANMVLVDFHPEPPKALVDARQALSLPDLPWFLEDIAITKAAYDARKRLAKSREPVAVAL